MVKMQDFKRLFAAALGHKEEKSTEAPLSGLDEAAITALIAAFGGRDNIVGFDACLTRLRVRVNALLQVDSEALQGLGAIGVIIIGDEVQAIFGKRSDNLRRELGQWFELHEPEQH
ncbi:glucose PTS transporter subunit EIIB [Aeromonas caviae]|uniref:glucose PTS transporter subunit EIIB n=1 Tax=Aeromonas caviae TaxID=648 RepID=UPI00191E893F|nr:glucose PTS transporter subunit EIIB [Aeromonas caviae]MBL0649021.1 PTS transporter subunit EIIB [Aeromonas caviae]